MREKVRAGLAWMRARWLWFFMPLAAATFGLGALSAIFGIKRTLAAAACALGLLADCTVAGVKPGKTVWDFLELMLVPLALAVVGYFFSLKERQAEQDIAKQRAMDDALKSYLDAMGGLLTDKGLSDPEPPEHVRNLARAYTLTVLNRVNGERRAAVVQFLYEAQLITTPDGTDKPKVMMRGANLQGVDLHGADLHGADLHGTDLHGANLQETFLLLADLHGADLHGADLRGTILKKANLQGANLQGANLHWAILLWADLNGANLHEALLQRANLHGANLQKANLHGADLHGANLSRADMRDVVDLIQAQLDSTISYRNAGNLRDDLTRDSRSWPSADR